MNPVLNLETHLPAWAQRSNAHVQRRLTITGRAGTLDIRRILVLFIIQAVIIALSLPLRALLNIQLPFTPLTLLLLPIIVLPYALGLISALMLPVLLVAFGRILFDVVRSANGSMFVEQQSDTLTLLRTTPSSLREILLSQMAGSIWRQVENIDLVLFGVAAFSLPHIALNHMMIWPTGDAWGLRMGMIAALAVTIIRPLLELLMAGALGTLGGMTASFRAAGTTWATILLGLYFVFLNVPRLLPLSVPLRIVFEIALPLLLPVLITWLALTFTEKLIRQD